MTTMTTATSSPFDTMRDVILRSREAGDESPIVHARMLRELGVAQEAGDECPQFMDLLYRAKRRDPEVLDAIDALSRMAFLDGRDLTPWERHVADWALTVLARTGRRPSRLDSGCSCEPGDAVEYHGHRDHCPAA